jgi:photosystem II stability/assembly factor-like uncharacterized protein
MNRTMLALALAGVLAALILPARAAEEAPAPIPAETQPLVLSQSLILDFAESRNRAIAVGERGHIAVSESRSDWRQVEGVPTRATLTAVDAVGEHAWAVGHDGTILASTDGGLSWKLQRVDAWRPLGDDEEFNPTQGAPLLDVLALSPEHVIAIGAYSLMLVTRDGGQTWTKVDPNAAADLQAEAEAGDEGMDETLASDDDWTLSDDALVLEDEEDPHLNGITRTPSGVLFVVGERGAAYRSADQGQTWERLRLPYDGSMFGVLALGEAHLLAYGLRGNVQESTDLGETWSQPETGTELSLQGGAIGADGSVLLVGSNGVLLRRPAGQREFEQRTFRTTLDETPVLAAVMPLAAREMVVAGEKGLGRYSLQ